MILTETSPDQRITGTIKSAISPGWWIIQDTQGRKYRAAGAGSYRKGDRVAILGGQIIGTAGSIEQTGVYQV